MDAHDEAKTVVLVVRGEVELVLGRMAGLSVDLALVEALARLQLVARRRGCSIRLRDPCTALCELLDLVGLAELVAGAPGLALEARRQAEGGEQLGIEEVVQPGDPAV